MRLFFILFIATAGCTFSPMASKKVVIDVNGSKMLAGKFAEELALRLKDENALSVKDTGLISQVKSRIAQEFIVQALSEQWAKQNNVLVKAEILEAEVQKIKSSYPDDLTFQHVLAQEGIAFKEWREKIQGSLLQKMVIEKLSEKSVAPSDEEIKAYFEGRRGEFMLRESVKIRQILLGLEGDAKTIETELKRGKSFADLAKKYSASPEGAMGGDVGWIEKGKSDVFEPAFKMRIGERSPIVKSPYGYHIFEVTAHRAGRPKLLNEVREEIRAILVEKVQKDLYFSWLDEQTRKARIFKDAEFIAALKVETKLR